MARSSPLPMSEEAAPQAGTGPLYFLAIPEQAYKGLSDLAYKRNKTLAEMVAAAINEFLKNHEGV